MEKTLQGATRRAKSMALADVYGMDNEQFGLSHYPFNAVAYLKTLPKEWQSAVEDAIVQVYHNT